MQKLLLKWKGAGVFAVVRTYLATDRKQGISMLQIAHLAFCGTPFILAIPVVAPRTSVDKEAKTAH